MIDPRDVKKNPVVYHTVGSSHPRILRCLFYCPLQARMPSISITCICIRKDFSYPHKNEYGDHYLDTYFYFLLKITELSDLLLSSGRLKTNSSADECSSTERKPSRYNRGVLGGVGESGVGFVTSSLWPSPCVPLTTKCQVGHGGAKVWGRNSASKQRNGPPPLGL